jgi:hypothetical protein
VPALSLKAFALFVFRIVFQRPAHSIPISTFYCSPGFLVIVIWHAGICARSAVEQIRGRLRACDVENEFKQSENVCALTDDTFSTI